MAQRTDIEWIEAYLQEELGEEERDVFEKRLQQEPELQRRLNMVREFNEAFDSPETIRFHEALQEVRDSRQVPTKKSFQIKPLYMLVGLAAAIVLLLLIWNPFAQLPSPAELGRDNYEPYKTLIASRDAYARDSLYSIAIQAYRQEDFAQAAEAFRQLEGKYPEVAALPFFTSVAYLGDQEAEEALIHFQSMPQVNRAEFEPSYSWYLALTYLQLDQVEQAIPLLEEVAKSSEYPQAKVMLETLEEL